MTGYIGLSGRACLAVTSATTARFTRFTVHVAKMVASSALEARLMIAFLNRRTAASSSSVGRGPLAHELIENLGRSGHQMRLRHRRFRLSGINTPHVIPHDQIPDRLRALFGLAI